MKSQRIFGIWLAVLLPIAQGATAQELPVWSVDPDPLVRVGGQEAAPEEVLFGVLAASRLSDDRIVVVTARGTGIKYFDDSGALLRAFGNPGDGPGELRGIMDGIPLPGDSLLVLSIGPGLTWYDDNGDYVRSQRINWARANRRLCRHAGADRRVLPDGSVVAAFGDNFEPAGCGPRPSNPWRETTLFVRERPTGGADSIAVVPGEDRNSPYFRVYGRTAVFAAGANRLFAADTGGDVILELDYSGNILRQIAMPFDAVNVPRSARRVRTRAGVVPGGEARPYLYPDHYPRLGRLLSDTTGHLWAMAFPPAEEPVSALEVSTIYGSYVEEGGARWVVLDAGGEPVARVRTPDRLFPLEIGEDYVVGLSTDDFDVEAVELYRLRRSGR